MNKEVDSAAQISSFLEKLTALNLEPVAQRLLHPTQGLGWTRGQVNEAIAQYKQFLYCQYLYPHTPLIPSLIVDQVWHHHILDTRRYEADCQWLFGYFLHHAPSRPESASACATIPGNSVLGNSGVVEKTTVVQTALEMAACCTVPNSSGIVEALGFPELLEAFAGPQIPPGLPWPNGAPG